jgi:hypothetical protein
MPHLAYKPNFPQLLDRLHSFYDRQADDRIFAAMDVPSPALEEFRQKYPQPQCEYPDPAQRAEFWDRWLRERAAIGDDSLPSAYLTEFDQGIYGGMLGGEVRFLANPDMGWISSMVPPLLHDLSELDRLRFDPSNIWWRRYLRQMDVFVERSTGKWGVGHVIVCDGLNFAFELVGATNAYLAAKERPGLLRRAIDFGHEINVIVQRAFFEHVPLFEGGTFSNIGQWLPGRIVTESIDPCHMASVAFFEEWGREPAERMLGSFDGGVIHLHGNGRHLLEAAVTIKGLRAICLADDRGFPPAFDVIRELKARAGDLPVVVFSADYAKFAERLDRRDLPGGVMYQVKKVPDIDAANFLMEKVRSYRT